MKYWLYPTNVKRFKIHEFLSQNEVIDYRQPKSIEVNDIVYLYCTLPEARIAYKMIVERVYVPFDELIDDSNFTLDFSLTNEMQKEYNFCRLRKLASLDSDELSLANLRLLNFKSCIQNAQHVPEYLIPIIEDCFK